MSARKPCQTKVKNPKKNNPFCFYRKEIPVLKVPSSKLMPHKKKEI